MSCQCYTPCNAGFFGSIGNFVHDAIYGTLSCCQKQQLINNQASGVYNAAHGNQGEYASSLTYSDAQTQAQQDVTNVLTINCADPSQSSLLGSAGFANLSKYAVLAIAISLFLFFAYAFTSGYARSR